MTAPNGNNKFSTTFSWWDFIVWNIIETEWMSRDDGKDEQKKKEKRRKVTPSTFSEFGKLSLQKSRKKKNLPCYGWYVMYVVYVKCVHHKLLTIHFNFMPLHHLPCNIVSFCRKTKAFSNFINFKYEISHDPRLFYSLFVSVCARFVPNITSYTKMITIHNSNAFRCQHFNQINPRVNYSMCSNNKTMTNIFFFAFVEYHFLQ